MFDKEILNAIELLEQLAGNGGNLENLPEDLRVKLMTAAGRLSRPLRDDLRRRNRDIHRARKQKVTNATKSVVFTSGIRTARRRDVYVPPSREQGQSQPLSAARNCYVCKAEYKEMHFFYDSMCPKCADFNYQKRFQSASMQDQVALITGARLKIGYQAALMMLRAGARVIITTRFPVDAAKRFAREFDFSEWRERVDVHGLDLRHTPSVELFCRFFAEKYKRLDVLINNAAQTVRRPPGFYSHLMAAERASWSELSAGEMEMLDSRREFLERLSANLPALKAAEGIGVLQSAELSQIAYGFDFSGMESFPEARLDADLQQIDMRRNNSWRMTLADVPTAEMLEVQLVNSVAPFVLCSRLVPLMRQSPTGKKHIVNVSAMEGKFTRFTKTDKHPHTNMAKAALNMLTHTSAKDLAQDGIYMNAVDTGWVTDEDPAALSVRKQEVHNFQPPLDIVDGAARICDPVFDGINTGQHWCGKFLKDYFPTEW